MKSYNTLSLKIITITFATLVLYLIVFWLSPTLDYYTHNQLEYLKLPLLIGFYISSIPFYLGIYYVLKLINLIEKDTFFTKTALKYFTVIKVLTFCEIIVYSLSLLYVYLKADFITSIFLIGLLVLFICFIIIIFIEIVKQLLSKAVDIKLENDLTIWGVYYENIC